jgi:hypothetical protein
MAQADVRTLMKRRDQAWQIKQEWRDLHADAYEYALPQRNLFKTGQDTSSQHPAGSHRAVPGGQKKVDRVFDSTAVTSTINFANRIQSDLMPPFQRWASLQAGPMVPEDVKDEVNARLEQVTKTMFAVIHASNFDTAINETLLDLAIGTGGMLILEGPTPDQPVMYIPVPLAKLMLEEGPWGTVSAIFRDMTEKVRNVEQQWPDADPLSDQKQKEFENNPDAEVQLIEATYYDQDEDIWRYEVIERNRTEAKTDEGKRLVSRTYDVSPWVTPRWIKVAGEVYGRGPVIQALPDIKTLNKMVELVLKNASLHISGVYTGVSDGVLNPNTVRITPGAVIPVASNGGTRGPSLMPLERTGSFDLANVQWEQLVMRIKEILLDNRLPPQSGPVRSATEIVERVKELVQMLGAPFGRMMTELIRPLLQRTLEILRKKQLVQKVKVDGLAVQVQVMSQLAQAQNMNDVETVVRWLSLLSSFGQEQMVLSAKVEDAGPWIGEKLGVPSKLIRSEDERKQMQQMFGRMQGAAASGAAPAGTTAPASSGNVAQPPLQTIGAANAA